MSIRSDNADLRLTEKGWQLESFLFINSNSENAGRAVGVVSDQRWTVFENTRRTIADTKTLLKSISFTPQGWGNHGIFVQRDGILRR